MNTVAGGLGPERSAASGTIEVWQGSHRLWRYRFLHPEGTLLWSNRGFLTKEEAVEAASLAYPGVAVAELAMPPHPAPRRHALRTVALVSVLAVVVGGVALAVAKVVMVVRRSLRSVERVTEWIRGAADLQRRDRTPPAE